MKYVAGIDVGGTKTMICIMDTNKKIGHTAVFGTQSDRGPEELVCKIGVVLSHIASKAGISFTDICAIGLGMPGPIDFEKGAMINPPNFPGWNDVPLVKLMRKKFNKPIVLENDVNAAALAESQLGVGKGEDDFVFVAIGTGIGGGVISGGKLLRGAGGNAAEIGHLTISLGGPNCGCGNRGCFEAYASGKALVRFAQKGLASGTKSIISKFSQDGKITAEHVFMAARQGDYYAQKLVEKEGYYLGVGIANVLNAFNPKVIALGGGIAQQLDMFYNRMMAVARKKALPTNRDARIVKAMLGKQAGVIGAARIAWQFLNHG